MKNLSTTNRKADLLDYQANRLRTTNWLHSEVDRYKKKVAELRKKVEILNNSSGDADITTSAGKFDLKTDQLQTWLESMLDQSERELEDAIDAFLKVSIEFNGSVIEA